MMAEQKNEDINDNNVRYNAKMEGYTTMMSYMNELSEIAGDQPDLNINFISAKCLIILLCSDSL